MTKDLCDLAAEGNLPKDWFAPEAPYVPEATPTMSTMKGALKDAFLSLQARYASKDRLLGMESGFFDLDTLLDGWVIGDVTLVAARSGVGKSIFALNLGLQLASRGHLVDYITIEMPTKKQAMRALYCWAKFQSSKVKYKDMHDSDWRTLTVAIHEMRNFPWVWDEKGSTTIDDIRKQIQLVKARAVAEGKVLKVVIIDHMLNIQGVNARQDRRQQVLYITQQLKAIAKEEQVCMVCLTQIRRIGKTVKDKRPTLEDLKESGSSEEDADNVILLYREDYYSKDDANGKRTFNNILEADLAKVRDGEPGKVEFRTDFNRYRIDPIKKEET